MPDSYTIKDQFGTYFLTFQIVAWVDLFTRKRYRDVVVDAFNYCVKEKQLQVHAWCIMSNHVHCIITSRCGALSDTVRDLKRHTAKSILSGLIEEPESRREWILFQFRKAAKEHIRNKEFQVWTHENHAVYIDPFISRMADCKLNYIHQNPVREGIVEKGEDYLYSSACDYAGKKGLIKLDKW